eukprot:309455-Amphidinium_carterae.1
MAVMSPPAVKQESETSPNNSKSALKGHSVPAALEILDFAIMHRLRHTPKSNRGEVHDSVVLQT